ncbi:MAG: hypothetical protein Kow0027_03590 [Saprospiraceae bacterium]|nr:hypothetical protein [Saprospirales bacterium]
MDKTGYTFTETEWGLLVVNEPGYVMQPAVVRVKWPAMMQKAREIGKHRILIESHGFNHRMSMRDWLELKDILISQAPEGLRIAFVLPGFVHTPDTELMLTIMNNYGVYNAFFDKREDAIAWLKGDDSK